MCSGVSGPPRGQLHRESSASPSLCNLSLNAPWPVTICMGQPVGSHRKGREKEGKTERMGEKQSYVTGNEMTLESCLETVNE